MKQKTQVLYFGLTKKGKPFFATTANGANLGGKVLFKVDLTKEKLSKRLKHAKRLRYLADRLET